MRAYIARRVLLLGPVLLGVSIVVFMVLHLSPGDPAEIMLGSQATQEDLERLRRELGLTEPLHVQYGRWLARAVRGDLGRSIELRAPVTTMVLERFADRELPGAWRAISIIPTDTEAGWLALHERR